MALITKNLELTSAWQDVTTGLSLAASSTYLMDLSTGESENYQGRRRAAVEWAVTDDATAPADDAIAHQWQIPSGQGIAAQSQWNQKAGQYLWIRKTTRDPARLVVTKI